MLNPGPATHPSTNRARRRVTSLIETNALPQSQTTTIHAYGGHNRYSASPLRWRAWTDKQTITIYRHQIAIYPLDKKVRLTHTFAVACDVIGKHETRIKVAW